MATNFWYHMGIGLPSFKAMVKGVNSVFKEVNPVTETKCFGSLNDNYCYFNTLMSNISEKNDVTHLLVVSLRKGTDKL